MCRHSSIVNKLANAAAAQVRIIIYPFDSVNSLIILLSSSVITVS